VGFVTLKEDVRPFATEVVQKDALTVLASSDHAFARRRRVKFLDLAKEPHIMFTEESEPEIRAKHRQQFAQLGVPAPRVVVEVKQLDVLLALVAAGVGIALMPGYFLRLGHMGVIGVPLFPKITVGISAIWHPPTLSPTGHRFLEVLRQTVASEHRE
jgi:DNA-binding transcriptional LysR family regulator